MSPPAVRLAPRVLLDWRGSALPVPDPDHTVHLQFRRFAGCPICDLHLRSFARRAAELAAASICELVVFHANADELAPFVADLPFAVIPDPNKLLYAEFGVGAAKRALLDHRAWRPIARAVVHAARGTLRDGKPTPSLQPHGGRWGLPADFLIASDGRVLAHKYGEHAADQWTVDDVLERVEGLGRA